ncbi:TetR/AcrR family transcriptional regulator [Arthrobacter sp. ov118]|jgi:TetR/AcrR family transcriptional repressor of lmrAB and yxaGH operons|uniref:TetR/AcrR family transcriptional regulator n=1 Tax=Arthrobacter sp. ov118 TaxID=1761747 RepID=UPI0008E596BA|nr:TetR/AcrR family transcriptional regulator [Arthrobacter sp. ov118]SFT86015.1 transcriptional regulator, TetR family [Arthrobacter sp. ov118]
MTKSSQGVKGAATRQRIIKSTLALFQKQGYYGTGLMSIVEAAGAPKGSVYFHFPRGKEEIAGEAVALAEKEFSALITEAAASATSPAAVVEAIIEALASMLEEGDFRVGCPVSVVTLEAAGSSEPLRQACAAAYDAWQQPIAALLDANGWQQEQSRSVASSMVSLVEGAMITSRARRSVAPLRDAGRTIELLLSVRGGGNHS